ncbi:MAG TPA: hypothetical protein VF472_19135 [Burkholderiaceae bacterium]
MKKPLKRFLSGTGLVMAIVAALAACGGGGGGGGNPGGTSNPPPVTAGFAWNGYARDAQHSDLAPTLAQGGVTAQNLGQIAWEVSIDANIDQTTAIHYGSPMITANNTVLIAVKTQTGGGFQMQARSAAKGALVWSANSDYVVPPHQWIPSFGSTLTPGNRLYMPGSGGKIYYMDNPDSAGGTMQTIVFYGASSYSAAPSSFDGTVYINTPITSDSKGNIFFGFIVTGSNPANLTSGFARIGADGSTTWAAAPIVSTSTGPVASAPSMNAAPGISNDGSTVYVPVHTPESGASDTGYLLALDSTTLATKSSVKLIDPKTGAPAWVADDSTASPVIGLDGDVYYGVLESNFPVHNARGWLLHFDSTLSVSKTPGSFGWDDTPSIVPASLVAAYKGTSSYLLMSKYNNYVETSAQGGSGDGKNRMAILDPNATEADPIAGNAVMNEVLTVLGPTADTTTTVAGAVREWCVNSAAVDPNGKAIFINSEDGKLYRWDLTAGTLTQSIWLDNGYGQAYTPTAIGPDGTVYSINNSTLIAVTK